jgi:hypothetical protein
MGADAGDIEPAPETAGGSPRRGTGTAPRTGGATLRVPGVAAFGTRWSGARTCAPGRGVLADLLRPA